MLVVLCRGDEPAERSASRSVAVAETPGFEFRGSGRCSATACHGSISPLDRAASRVRRNEHTTWVSDDAHSRAYQVLVGELSERIERNLTGGSTPAHKDVRCLACHTTPRPAAVLAATSWMDSDGVGCESCHGASANWLGPHTTTGWERMTRAEKAARPWGMVNTKDLAVRAEVCAGCHVGRHSPDGLLPQDVNHDLIAAGHPRLNFELAAFLDNLPPHWDEKDENAGPFGPNQRAADFPARAWAIGRLATVKAALDLLEKRAAGAEAAPEPLVTPLAVAEKPSVPWPEFTEYGCFSCHHDLRDRAWRRRSRADGVKPGTPRWGSWPLPLIGDLIEKLIPQTIAQPYAGALRPLSEEMAKPFPVPKVVQEEARKTADALGHCLEPLASKRFDAAEVQQLIDRLDRREAWDRVASWDEATQLYLALVALRQAWMALAPERKADQDRLGNRLEELRCQLMFPKGYDSPRYFDPAWLPARAAR